MTQPNPTIACSRCRYWQQVGEEDGERLGVCRRLPPSYEGWPMTRAEDWCGEFAGIKLN